MIILTIRKQWTGFFFVFVFVFFLGKLGGGGQSEKRIRKQKGNKEKGEVLKRENSNNIYIKNTTSPLPTLFNVSLVE